MRAKLIAPVAVATIVAAAGVAAVGIAAVNDHPRVIRLLAVDEQPTPIDGQDSVKPGARFLWRVGLFHWTGHSRGARVGRVDAFCTIVARNPEEAYCDAGFSLPGGQVLASGFYRYDEEDEDRPQTVAVIGGTGAYAGAHGFVRATSIGPEESGRSAIELHLAP